MQYTWGLAFSVLLNSAHVIRFLTQNNFLGDNIVLENELFLFSVTMYMHIKVQMCLFSDQCRHGEYENAI